MLHGAGFLDYYALLEFFFFFAVFCSLAQYISVMLRFIYTYIYVYVCIYIHVRITGTVFSLALIVRIFSMCWTKNCHLFSRVFMGLSRS